MIPFFLGGEINNPYYRTIHFKHELMHYIFYYTIILSAVTKITVKFVEISYIH
ncbi:hypothetical protein JOC85_000795 [Bacillus mesophilus]|nr:hypothetical protein [Bacillus mesophilus]